MASNKPRRNVSYGLTNALQTIGPIPVVSSRAPSTSDVAEIGTVWVNKGTSAAWILAKVAAGSATWTPTSVNAGATIATGDFTVTTGDIFVTAGDITANAGSVVVATDVVSGVGDITAVVGDVIAGADMTAGVHITATAGDITATLGTVTAGVDVIAGRSAFVAGDEGTGTASQLGLTNVFDTTVSTGAGVVLMKTSNPGDSAGWIKMYNGTTVIYVPYWTNLSP